MTAYNRENYVAEAINSVLASTYSNFELIIVDDASTDQTVKVVSEYLLKDSRIRLYVNSENLGDYPNRNKASEYANGQYIMYLDSDDKFYPNAIEYVVASFFNFPLADYATIYQYDDINIPVEYSSTNIIKLHFFEKSILHIGPSGTAIKKGLFAKIGGFTTKYGPANDMYYNLKVASNSRVILLPYKYLFYRIHDGQESNNKFSYLYNGYLYFRDIMNLPELPLSLKEKQFLLLKNKRRFIINSIKYLLKEKELLRTLRAYRLARFSILDFFQAIFHL